MDKLPFSVVVIVIVGTLFGACSAVDIELADDGPCPDPRPEVAHYDEATFSNSSFKWYHQFWSKYYVYRVAKDVTRKEYEDITQREIKNSCITFSPTKSGMLDLTGFSGGLITYELAPGNFKGTFQWKSSGKSEWDAETWITKADKDYFVALSCFSTNQKGITVASLQKTLSPSLRLEILEHIKSLGFKSNSIFEQDMENCVDKQTPTSGNNTSGSGPYFKHVPTIPFTLP